MKVKKQIKTVDKKKNIWIASIVLANVLGLALIILGVYGMVMLPANINFFFNLQCWVVLGLGIALTIASIGSTVWLFKYITKGEKLSMEKNKKKSKAKVIIYCLLGIFSFLISSGLFTFFAVPAFKSWILKYIATPLYWILITGFLALVAAMWTFTVGWANKSKIYFFIGMIWFLAAIGLFFVTLCDPVMDWFVKYIHNDELMLVSGFFTLVSTMCLFTLSWNAKRGNI